MMPINELFFKLLEARCRDCYSNYVLFGRKMSYEDFREEYLEKFIANAEDFTPLTEDPNDE